MKNSAPDLFEDLLSYPEESLPLLVLELLEQGFAENPLYQGLAYQVGNGIEIETLGLSLVNPTLLSRALTYWAKVDDFFAAFSDESCQELPALDINRNILTKRQSDTINGKADLKEEYQALLAIPLWGKVVKDLLVANPDKDNLLLSVTSLGGKLDFADGEATLTFTLPARNDWSPALGSFHSRGEYKREFVVKIKYAKWRDRRVRRLYELTINAKEFWPEI